MKMLCHSLQGGLFAKEGETKDNQSGTWSRVPYAIQMSKRAFDAGVLINLSMPYDLLLEMQPYDLEGKWWWANIETHNETKKLRTERGPKEMTIAVVDEIEFYGIAQFADFQEFIGKKFSGQALNAEKQYEAVNQGTGEVKLMDSTVRKTA